MNKIIYLILTIIVFISCNEKKRKTQNIQNENLTEIQIDSILNEFKFQYENPIVLDSTNQILIPISTKLVKGKKSSYSKGKYSSDDFPTYWNILFYNRATEKTNLLTNEKFSISNIYAKQSDNYGENKKIIKGKILYKISDIDYNKDRELNNEDPDFLFISEIDGTKLQRISPKNESLVYYEILEKSNEIIFETIRDTNNDSIFDTEDEYIWYKSKMENKKWVNSEIINPLNRKTIKNLYFEQWLKKK